MAIDFKPHHSRITLTIVIGGGIIHELTCADSGAFVVDAKIEPRQIGLYTASLSAAQRVVRNYTVFCRIMESGEPLMDEQCRNILNLPVKIFEECEHKSPHWLKSSVKPHKLDRLVTINEIINRESEKLSLALAEEIDELERQVKSAESEYDNVTNDRMKLLGLEKKANLLRWVYMKKQEGQFFDAMRLDLELEQRIKEFIEKEKLTARVTREFLIKVEGIKNGCRTN